jgi:hypothetical protein
MPELKPNEQLVAEFVTPFTMRLKEWLNENSLEFVGGVDNKRIPGDAKHPQEGFLLYMGFRHKISGQECELGISFGERFNKPIPETLDELNEVMKSVTDPLTDYFWPGKRRAEIVH